MRMNALGHLHCKHKQNFPLISIHTPTFAIQGLEALKKNCNLLKSIHVFMKRMIALGAAEAQMRCPLVQAITPTRTKKYINTMQPRKYFHEHSSSCSCLVE
jgi:hypothetical protein